MVPRSRPGLDGTGCGGVPHASSPLAAPKTVQAGGGSAKAREHRSKAGDSRIQAKVFQELAVFKVLARNPNYFIFVTPKPSRIPSPAKRERTGAKRQVRVENAERRALMAAARFVGCPSPSPGAASPRRPLPLRGRGGRRTSQLGSSILFSRSLRADAGRGCGGSSNCSCLPQRNAGSKPSKAILLSASGLGRKAAAATSRPRAFSRLLEIRRRLHANLAFHPAAVAVRSTPYAMRFETNHEHMTKIQQISRTGTSVAGLFEQNRGSGRNSGYIRDNSGFLARGRERASLHPSGEGPDMRGPPSSFRRPCAGSASSGAPRRLRQKGEGADLSAAAGAPPFLAAGRGGVRFPAGAGRSAGRPFFDRRLGGAEAFPGVARQRSEPLRRVGDGEMGGPDRRPELVPVERHRDGRAGARAGRIGGDRGRAALVAQIVDEDLARAASPWRWWRRSGPDCRRPSRRRSPW